MVSGYHPDPLVLGTILASSLLFAGIKDAYVFTHFTIWQENFKPWLLPKNPGWDLGGCAMMSNRCVFFGYDG